MGSHAATGRAGPELVLRVLVVAALGTDAVVHLRLASTYEKAFPGGIGGGTLFQIEAGAAILVAVYLLVSGSRLSYALAGLVLGTVFVAVVLTTYVQVPGFGPIPAIYEPIWFFEKTLSAVAEGVGAALATLGVVVVARRRRTSS